MTTNGAAATVNIGTILLEPGRWARPKRATYAVAEWMDRFVTAGFDGAELWENHADADALGAEFPVAIFNTYCGFGDDEAEERAIALRNTRAANANAVKFNVGGEESRAGEYARNLEAWVADLPTGCRPLCECHGGTIVETPGAARAFFDGVDIDCGIITHAFADPEDRLRDWLRLFGSKLELVHVQLRNEDGVFLRLDEAADHARRRIDILGAAEFAGSYTLEFTKGTGTPDDTPEALWREALADLAFLREHA